MATLEYERCRLAKLSGEKNQLSVRKIVDQINKKYLNLPTDHQLNRGNVERTVREGLAGTSPKKNGRPPKIHDELVHACHLQTATMQASGGAGEADKMSMTSTTTALTEGTINEGIFYLT